MSLHRPAAPVAISTETPSTDAGRHVWARTLIAGSLAVCAVVGGLAVTATAAEASTMSAPPAGYLTRHVLGDDFNRTVRSGWGVAPVGGRYRSYGSTGRAMTLRGNAYFANLPSGHSRVQRSAVESTDVLATTTVSIARIPRKGSWGTYVGLELRAQSDNSAYSATIKVATHGRARLLISRRSGHGSPVQLAAASVPTMYAGRSYTLQAAVVGTRLWARTYRTGTHPRSWLTANDASRSAIRSAGRAGIISATAGRHTTSTVRFGSLNAYSPARTVSQPTPPVTVPPVTTPPVTVPPVTTPPVTVPPVTTPPVTTPPVTTPPVTTPPVTTPPVTTPPVTTPPVTTASHASQVIANAGAAALGTTSYAIPAGAIFVSPSGDNSTGNGSLSAPYASVTRALQAATSGSTIVVRGGTYHESVYIRANLQVTIQSYPGETVWFDGSVPVTGWTQSGNDWVHSGWNAQFDHSASFSTGSNAGGFVNSAYPMAAWPDQVFFDGVQLQQVAANPSAGEFAVDYANRQLIVGSDPTGHAVRASDLSQAFVVAGQAILRGFGIHRFATALPQIGTLYIGGSGGSTVQNVVVDNNAGQGLATSSHNDVVDHVSLTNNGMSGMSDVYSDGAVIENSLISGNNTQHFNSTPSAAGLKVTRLDGVVVRDNLVQNNLDITGIWTDENVTHFAITGNVVRNNGNAYGIETELSGTGVVANNTISGSKYGYTAYDSGNISVYNNDVDNNRVWDIGMCQDARYQPGKGTAGPRVQPSAANPWIVQNIVVADNNFGRSNGMFQVYILDKQTNRPADSMNLQISGNQFAPRVNTARPWAIGWGMADNTTVHAYATPAAFDAGESKNWVNTVAADGTGLADASSVASSAVPLPSDVAAAIGQVAGAQHVGAF